MKSVFITVVCLGIACAQSVWASCVCCPATDDHANSTMSATVLSMNVTDSGDIEAFLDTDWYSFPVQQNKEYTITVTSSTIDDTSVMLKAGDGTTYMLKGDSVGGNKTEFKWANPGTAGAVFIEVGAFAGFTTGTYTVKVTQTVITDSDGDGLPDSWEMEMFGTLAFDDDDHNDADEYTNMQEYLAGTHPVNDGSYLYISQIDVDGNDLIVTWPAAPLREYDLYYNDDALSGGSWLYLGSEVNLDGSAFENHGDVNGTTNPDRCYRVILAP